MHFPSLTALQGQEEFYFSSANYFQIKASVEIRSTSFVCIGMLLGLENYHGPSEVIQLTVTGSNISAPRLNLGFQTPTALSDWAGSVSGQHSWDAGAQYLFCTEYHWASLSMALWFVVGTWPCDSQVATNIIARFPVGGSSGHISTEAFLTHSMNWHCSLKPKLTSHKKKLQRFQECFFTRLTTAALPHITKYGLTLLHPRYQISSIFPGKVWTVSVTLKAFSSKYHFIGGEAGTEKQSSFLEVTK